MEEAKTTFQPNAYDAKIYKFGRWSTLAFLLILIGVPLSMSIVWGVEIDILTTFKAFFTPFAMFLVVGTVEVFTLAPMLGPGGTFLSFNNGNTMNMTMPAAVSALKVAGYEAGTRQGEVVSLIAISTSVIVSKVILAAGMFGMMFILPVLESPTLQPAFNNFMPALLGALCVPVFIKDPRTSAVPAALAAIVTIIFGYSVIEGIEPLIMPFFLAITAWWKYKLYKSDKAKKEALAASAKASAE
jgi:hypothetical protein